MVKLNRLILLLLAFGFSSVMANAQCKFDHTLKIEQAVGGSPGGRLLITSAEPSVLFKIYMEKEGVISLLESKKVSFISKSISIEVFESLQPGKYHVLAEWDGCKSGVGGMEGITIY